MAEDNQPFAGIRVVEFGQFVAVPYCGQLLAEGGAHVIKVESLDGDPNRHMGEISPNDSRIFVSRNRGKHALPLKLGNPNSKPIVDALIATTDVVLMNFRPGLAVKLGLDPTALLEAHPALIIGEITPFGKEGPDALLAGMDIVVQARSGLMAAMGRIVDGRPAPGDPVISDYMAATSLAYGVSSALLRRERTGAGGIVDVSLMQSAMALANNQLIRHEELDREVHREAMHKIDTQRRDGAPYEDQLASIPGIRVYAIRNIYFRTYETADGTIAIACASKGLQDRFNEALDLTPPTQSILTAPAETVNRLRRDVEEILRSKASQHWVQRLNDAGVPVSTVKFPLELFEDEQAQANRMFELVEHPSGSIRVLSPHVKINGKGFTTRPPTKPFATETRTILAELGFSDEKINEFLDQQLTRGE